MARITKSKRRQPKMAKEELSGQEIADMNDHYAYDGGASKPGTHGASSAAEDPLETVRCSKGTFPDESLQLKRSHSSSIDPALTAGHLGETDNICIPEGSYSYPYVTRTSPPTPEARKLMVNIIH